MRKAIITSLVTLPLAGCATFGLQDPWAAGTFNSAVWQADLVKVKAAAKSGGDAALAAMDALCPAIQPAAAVVNDPTSIAAAQSVFGVNAATKNVNNINDALDLLADACTTRNATSAQQVLVAGAQAINDAKRILAAKGSK